MIIDGRLNIYLINSPFNHACKLHGFNRPVGSKSNEFDLHLLTNSDSFQIDKGKRDVQRHETIHGQSVGQSVSH